MLATNENFYDVVFADKDNLIRKDLKLNLKKFLEESSLSGEEANLLLLALGTSLKQATMVGAARVQLQQLGVSEEQIQEAADAAALMGMLNTYYRFRYMVASGNPEAKADYERAGLRMTIFSRPALGKERLELIAFALSVLNGCSDCVVSHEKALRSLQISAEKIHDIARLSAILAGISKFE